MFKDDIGAPSLHRIGNKVYSSQQLHNLKQELQNTNFKRIQNSNDVKNNNVLNVNNNNIGARSDNNFNSFNNNNLAKVNANPPVIQGINRNNNLGNVNFQNVNNNSINVNNSVNSNGGLPNVASNNALPDLNGGGVDPNRNLAPVGGGSDNSVLGGVQDNNFPGDNNVARDTDGKVPAHNVNGLRRDRLMDSDRRENMAILPQDSANVVEGIKEDIALDRTDVKRNVDKVSDMNNVVNGAEMNQAGVGEPVRINENSFDVKSNEDQAKGLENVKFVDGDVESKFNLPPQENANINNQGPPLERAQVFDNGWNNDNNINNNVNNVFPTNNVGAGAGGMAANNKAKEDEKPGSMKVVWDWSDFAVNFEQYVMPEQKLRRAPHATTGEPWPLPQYYVSKKDKIYKIDKSSFRFDMSKVKCDIIEKAVERYRPYILEDAVEDMYDNFQHAQSTVFEDPSLKYDTPLYLNAPVVSKVLIKIHKPCDKYPHENMDESCMISF